MAKKRIFLDECCSDLKRVFARKHHVYTATDFGIKGKEDPLVIDKAFERKCVIVTVNKDFLEHYRNHPLRKSRRFFYGLIFLKPSKQLPRDAQLRKALKEIAWEETRKHDDLVTVSSTGKTKHERLCHKGCAAAFPKEQTDWE